jgi:hypothetical protein
MKNNKQMPDEPTVENHPASAWGWFLAGFAYIVALFAGVMFLLVRTANNPAWNASVAQMQSQLGTNYSLICMAGMLVLFVPFLVALDRAGRISYQYRRQRGQTTREDDLTESNAGFFKFMIIAAALALFALMIFGGK